MIVIGGQVKRETLRATAPVAGLRQLGDQEADTMRMMAPITKAQWLLADPADADAVIDEAIAVATGGRPGPVWIEVPVDVQGAKVARMAPTRKTPARLAPDVVSADALSVIAARLTQSHRPVILMGTGVRLSETQDAILALAERHSIPVVTAWTHDIIDSARIRSSPADPGRSARAPATLSCRTAISC